MQEKNKIAEAILDAVAANICRKIPVLWTFTRLFERVPVEDDILLESDGLHLFYNPARLIKKFQQKELPKVEDAFLHIITHGLLGHFGMREQFGRKQTADAVMDYEAVRMMADMGWSRSAQESMEQIYCCGIFAESISSRGVRQLYSLAGKNRRVASFFDRFRDMLSVDDHHVWERSSLYLTPLGNGGEDGAQKEGQMAAGFAGKVSKIWEKAKQTVFGETAPGDDLNALMKQFSNGYGSGAGGADEMVRAASGAGRSYRDILEQVCGIRECFKEREDSIDRMLYAYGFDTYGDVALVEPEELNEINKLHTIVLAIDTSGSCSGDIMKYFLRETKSILRDACRDGGFEQLLLLQCDAGIQDEKSFQSPEELPEGDSFCIRGYGGTDFRPLFERVEELRRTQELQVDCLLYLTDGYGSFPDGKPDYPVYLILPYAENASAAQCPAWAEKVYLGKCVN